MPWRSSANPLGNVWGSCRAKMEAKTRPPARNSIKPAKTGSEAKERRQRIEKCRGHLGIPKVRYPFAEAKVGYASPGGT